MKTLLWMRHGKSDWDRDPGSDHDRPLAKRGAKAAEAMGAALQRLGMAPDVVLASSAVRARTTAERVVKSAGWKREIGIRPRFYSGGVDDVLAAVRETDPAAASVLVVGHEPTWSAGVATVTGAEVVMVTAAVACVELDVDTWRQVQGRCGRLLWFLPPRLLDKLG